MPTYQKPPTVNDDARAQDIYREAARIISEKGFDATSMGDIAETVDLTKGGLYYYIKGKKALLFAIMNFALDLIENRVMAPAREERDADRKLAGLISTYVKLVLEEPAAIGILASEDEKLDPSYRPRIMERKRAYTDFLRDCIAEATQDQGSAASVDPSIAAFGMLGLVHGVVHWCREEKKTEEPGIIEQVTQIALQGLIPPS